ncbi:MAG: Trm112 family protein [Alphaproteobacteria bacterium]|nr:Trm112 family protein [Alphaproteobacteria bacterium]
MIVDVDPNLLNILVCPVTKGPLEYDKKAQELISRAAGLAYPIRNGIPIMLADEARSLEKETKSVKISKPKSKKKSA